MDKTDVYNYEEIKAYTIEKITYLLEKYKYEPQIINKLDYEINQALEKTIDSHISTISERSERKIYLTKQKDKFTHRFLNKNNYFYLPATDLFVLYNKKHYILYNEDDIVHEILTQISMNKDLHPWKHKIKNNLIKIIKSKHAYDYIPETGTIQSVLQYLYPVLFKNKYYVKYFLTIIGDIILKKPTDLIYIISNKFSPILIELSNYCYNYFGANQISNTFKLKYHDHDYNNCRLLLSNDIHDAFEFPEYFYKNILDLFCVSIHYSKRYGSSDDYLKECYESELVQHALYLKNTSQENIIVNFIDIMLQKSDTDALIDMKDMLYLWKTYLKNLCLPNIIFLSTVKTMLISRLTYDEAHNSFINLTSTHLPLVSEFIKFWSKTIVVSCDLIGFEADELVCLFKKYLGKSSIAIKDDLLIEWILHYYPDIIIKNNKYIQSIGSSQWCKKNDFSKALLSFKSNINDWIGAPLDDFYRYYCKFAKDQKCVFVMSKYYFDLIAPKYLKIDEDGMISGDGDESCA